VRPPLGCHPGEQVWRDGNVTGGGDFVGEFPGPIAEAKNLVNDENYRALVLGFWVDHQSIHAAAIVLPR